MVIEDGYFVVGLVEFWGENDFVPDSQTEVGVQQLVWEDDRLVFRGLGKQVPEALLDIAHHAAAADIYDLAVLRELESSHDCGCVMAEGRTMQNKC